MLIIFIDILFLFLEGCNFYILEIIHLIVLCFPNLSSVFWVSWVPSRLKSDFNIVKAVFYVLWLLSPLFTPKTQRIFPCIFLFDGFFKVVLLALELFPKEDRRNGLNFRFPWIVTDSSHYSNYDITIFFCYWFVIFLLSDVDSHMVSL